MRQKPLITIRQTFTVVYLFIFLITGSFIAFQFHNNKIILFISCGIILLGGLLYVISIHKYLAGRVLENTRKQSELEMLFNNLKDVVWAVSLPDRKLLFINSATKDMYGVNEDIFFNDASEYWLKAVHPDDQEIAKKGRDETFKTGISSTEYRIVRPDGTIKWALDRKVVLKDENNDIQLLSGVLTDITERKKLEEQLINSERMAAVGQLSAGVAHEFNNILAIIRLQSQLILKKVTDCPHEDKNISALVDIIQNQTAKAAGIVSNMNLLAKPQEIQKQNIKLSSCVNDLIELMKSDFENENISIETDYSGDDAVCIDKNQIQQVLLNIIINACHAIKPKKKGTISISISEMDDKCLLSVTDNGVGISNEDNDKIFLPFFTTKGGYSRNNFKTPGTGLGLAVSYQIMKHHGGSISFKSVQGEKTVFNLILPLASQAL